MAIISTVGLVAGSIVTALLARVVSEEIAAWSPRLTKYLVRLAVSRLPSHRRQRFAEEWESYLNDLPGQISRLIAAVGLCCAAWKINLGDQFSEGQERLKELLELVSSTWMTSSTLIAMIESDEELMSDESVRAHTVSLKAHLARGQISRDALASVIRSSDVANLRNSGINPLALIKIRRMLTICDQVKKEAEEAKSGCLEIITALTQRRTKP